MRRRKGRAEVRHIQAQKRVGSKVTRYKNLAAFNSECSSRGYRGNSCELTNLRCTKDGGGLATVKSEAGLLKPRPAGTWLLHFASCSVMKGHLRKRVIAKRPAMLHGARRRR